MIHCEQAFYIKLSYYLADHEVERVAALIGKKVGDDYFVTDVLPAQNEDRDPANMFFVSNRQVHHLMLQASQQGEMLLGFAHSHPSHHPSNPSMADIRACRHNINAVYHPATQSLIWFNGAGEIASQAVHSYAYLPILNSPTISSYISM